MATSTITRADTSPFQVAIFARGLPPESFAIHAQRAVRHGAASIEAWVLRGGHVVRFDAGRGSVSEFVGPRTRRLPLADLVMGYAAVGDHEAEHQFPRAAYLSSVQAESLPDGLYLSNLDELAEFGRECGALVNQWQTVAGPCLSMVDVQHLAGQTHVQSYHLKARGGLILRTQTIFEPTPG